MTAFPIVTLLPRHPAPLTRDGAAAARRLPLAACWQPAPEGGLVCRWQTKPPPSVPD